MRPAAKIFPAQLPGGGIQVVVDGELGTADLDRRVIGCAALAALAAIAILAAAVAKDTALKPDQLQLVRLSGEFLTRRVVADHTAGEQLPLLYDLAHPPLDGGQIVRRERPAHIEVVVETVLDRRPDAQPGLGKQVLYRLRHHMCRRMAHDRSPVGAGERDRFHHVAVGQWPREVTQLTVDLGRDGGRRREVRLRGVRRRAAAVADGLARGGAGRHHMLAPSEGDAQLRHVRHRNSLGEWMGQRGS